MSWRSPPSTQLALLFDLFAQACFLRSKFTGGVARREVFGVEDLANLDLAVFVVGIWAPFNPFDGLVHGLHFPEPEASDQLLRLRKWPVDDEPLPTGEPNALPLGAGMKTLARKHHASFHQLFVELAHLREQLLARQHPRLGILAGFDNNHDFHLNTSLE